MSEQGQWGNSACLGYALLGAAELGYSEQETEVLLQAIRRQFDLVTIGEARNAYEAD
ncbi:hypothetical protein [Paenibacillus phytohabitans]|uniref:hypothetical protein n=1 Tax=Paenibacillus phytohabitans TaxID=2654978 RepID=UPI001491A2F1|nr:hypothetical protein [Paenibacillus phytohabitans]